MQRVVDRQADRACQLAQVVGVGPGDDAPAAQEGTDPVPAQVTLGVGSGQRAPQLEPGHLDRDVSGQEHAVVGRHDVDVVEDRDGQGQPAEVDGVRCLHDPTLPAGHRRTDSASRVSDAHSA